MGFFWVSIFAPIWSSLSLCNLEYPGVWTWFNRPQAVPLGILARLQWGQETRRDWLEYLMPLLLPASPSPFFLFSPFAFDWDTKIKIHKVSSGVTTNHEPTNSSADRLSAMAASIRQIIRSFPIVFHRSQESLSQTFNIRFLSDKIIDESDTEPPIPEYKRPENETNYRKRARLLYQSRWVSFQTFWQLIRLWGQENLTTIMTDYSVCFCLPQETRNAGKWIVVEVGKDFKLISIT